MFELDTQRMNAINSPDQTITSTQGGSSVDQVLHFHVSTGLKRVLGRELITNDEVAIFELVKNSFDASATEVYLHFTNEAIVVADNGLGMTLEDLRKKWLFVAYSAKRDASRQGKREDYRDQLGERVNYAGSKGIGRFSTDRLGQRLTLQTKAAHGADKNVHCLAIDWGEFEEDDQRQFDVVDVIHTEIPRFELPEGIPVRRHGTVIAISQLSRSWTRDDLLRLRSGLAKLINPFGDEADGFSITIIANQELAADQDAIARAKSSKSGLAEDVPVVNGSVGNFIFSTLHEKTTFIDVSLSANGSYINSVLTDRGEIIYEIREANPYTLLKGASFRCQLFYLNRAAKATFTRRMGVPSVRFGSVFLFRNGFRVFPIGEEGDDWYGIDRRKQQGYARFLGTRDVIGRIDVSGTETMFQEASSRNDGLIRTPAVIELMTCFREYCLKRLERYVVPVSWGTKDIDTETLAFLETDNGRARVTTAVANLIGSEDIEVLRYSKRLIDLINERSEQFESSLVNLRVIAAATGDQTLAAKIDEAEERFQKLRQSEAEARRKADEERKAKEEAEERARQAEADAETAKQALGEERKRNLFLAAITSLDTDTILSMHHLVTIYALDIQQQVENLLLRIPGDQNVSRELIVTSIEPISLLARKIHAVAKFATRANFRVDSEYIEEDLSDYIISYIEEVAKNFLANRIGVDVITDRKPFVRKFKPIEVSIVVDNLISNARKARATKIKFELTQPRKEVLEVRVADDGRGILPAASSENRLFEKGYTTTEGSGLGLYHVRQVISEMGGSIENEQANLGASFLVRIPQCG